MQIGMPSSSTSTSSANSLRGRATLLSRWIARKRNCLAPLRTTGASGKPKEKRPRSTSTITFRWLMGRRYPMACTTYFKTRALSMLVSTTTPQHSPSRVSGVGGSSRANACIPSRVTCSSLLMGEALTPLGADYGSVRCNTWPTRPGSALPCAIFHQEPVNGTRSSIGSFPPSPSIGAPSP